VIGGAIMVEKIHQFTKPSLLKIKVPLSLLMSLSFLVGCAPQYHDFSEVRWTPITEVFQEAYSIEWDSFENRQEIYRPLTNHEFISLADGDQGALIENYQLWDSKGLLFQVPVNPVTPLHISDLKIRTIYSQYDSHSYLNDGAIKLTSFIGDKHGDYDREVPFQTYQSPVINVCTDYTSCGSNGDFNYLTKDYEVNYLQYPIAEDGTHDWSIDTLMIRITGFALGFYYVKLDEIYVKVVSEIVMP
jgi:hypothetical protein